MKTRTILLAVLCLCLSCLIPAAAQKTVIPASSFGERGLPYSILDIIQDSRGYMWFASLNGLVRYDGYNYTIYQHDPYDAGSLAHDFVSCILEDRQDGALWVGTNDGLSRFDPRTETFTNYYHEPGDTATLPGNIIIRLAQSEDGDIWIGTLQDGLGRFHKATGKFRKYQSFRKENICLYDVWGIVPDGGRLWLGTEMGVFLLDGLSGKAEPVILSDSPGAGKGHTGKWVMAMRRYHTEALLVRFSNGEEYLLNTETLAMKLRKRSLGGSLQARALPYTDREGNTWTALEGGGYSMESPYTPKFRPFGIAHGGITYGRANPILHTADGSFWVGSDSSGILRIDGRTGERSRIYSPQGGPANCAYSLAPGPDNSIWVLSEGKMYGISSRGEVIREVAFPDRMFYPSGIITDSRGWVWAGSFKRGVVVYQPEEGTFRYFYRDFSLADSKDHNQVGDIMEDSRGAIWMATYGGGVYRLDPHTLAYRNFQFNPANPNSLANDQANSLFEDRQGRIWIGTGRGLSRLEWKNGEPHFTNWTTENSGLPNNRVFGILQDGQGRFWLSTDGGLACFEEKKGHFTVFSSHDGFRGVFLEHGDFKYQGPNGNMYFYGDGGTVSFHPDSLAYNPHPPEVVFTGLKLENRYVEPGGEAGILHQNIGSAGELHLSWRQNNFTIEFAALSLAAPEKNRYRYRLRGHDKGWVETDAAKRYANYNNLGPGNYILEVQGSNNDGVWSEAALALPLAISPPWWKRWWAYTSYLLAILFIAYSLYRFQLNRRLEQQEAERLKEMDAMKARLYTNITHEFRTPLSIITGMASRIKDNPREWLDDGVSMIKHNTSRLLQLVNQMLDLARLESGGLPVNNIRADVIPFLRYLADSFEAYADSEGVRLHFLPRTASLEMDFDPEKLQQVLINLLSNAIKFTPEGGDIYVMAEQEENAGAGPVLKLQVRDTGAGIPEDRLEAVFERFYSLSPPQSPQGGAGAGVGLAIARELARLMGGNLTAESPVGEGATFTACIPITRLAAPGAPVPASAAHIPTRRPEIGNIAGNSPQGAPMVLLAEDNPGLIHYLASCLRDSYRLLIAADGKEGLAMAVTHTPDLIISDIMMPEMDGYALCRQLRADERTSHIPIILLTAKADHRSKLDGLKCGADAYLAKPFDEEELYVRIQKLLESRRRLQQYFRASLTGEKGCLEKLREAEAFPPASPFLEKVREIIKAHISDSNFSVGQLCQEAGMSHSQLHRKLSALTGQPATYFIRHLRLQHARELLKDPALTIAAVAYDAGFSDPDYFSKVFRKEFGKTPSEFRDPA